MKIINTVEQWKENYSLIKNYKIGFVPTMGGLHEGHISLIKKSIEENQITVVSIYLNPTQFNDKNDLLTYPANFEDDCKILDKLNVDFVFAPTYDVIYPDNYKYVISEKEFSKLLCGATRPGHFDGVLTVVMKLFNIIKPNNAYFGEKDYQQYKLLDGLVKAFFLDVKLIPCPIIREDSGLALSSRNRKLSKEGIKIASKIHQIISSNNSLEDKEKMLINAGFTIDYITQIEKRLYVAVFLEGVRLIDNVELK